MIDIVKLANGNVAIYDSTSGDFINSLSPDIVEIECNVNGSVKIVQDNGSVEYIDPAQVANTEVVPAAAIPFSGTCADLAALLSSDFFFVVSGGGPSVTPDLATVLAAGNIAGTDINMNGNDLLNVDTITSIGDLILNPVGSIDANGNTINMTGGEIHNIPLIHSQNNTDLTIEGKGTGDLVFETNNVERLRITDAGVFVGLPNTEGWTYIVKSANQDVTNNSTPQDDTELQFSVVAGGHYMVQIDLTVSANDLTGDYAGRFLVSAGTMKGNGLATILSNLGAAGSNAIQLQNANSVAQTTAFVTGAPVADLDNLISGTIIFSFTASANATFKYQFSNSSAAAGRTSRTWKGTILKYKRID